MVMATGRKRVECQSVWPEQKFQKHLPGVPPNDTGVGHSLERSLKHPHMSCLSRALSVAGPRARNALPADIRRAPQGRIQRDIFRGNSPMGFSAFPRAFPTNSQEVS